MYKPQTLSSLSKSTQFVSHAEYTRRLPKYGPGELLEPSMFERLQTMEGHINQLSKTQADHDDQGKLTRKQIQCPLGK